MSNFDLFIELAQPDENGFSRWVRDPEEFEGKFAKLKHGNGFSWGRKSSKLAQIYNIEKDRTITPGNSIDRIRLAGFKDKFSFKQNIRQDIRDFYKGKKCVMLGVCGNSENTTIEIDHKDGRKDSERISNLETQKVEDFQPLCKAANDIKRQICKKCKETNKRWDAKNIEGNPYSFYQGDENFTLPLGCVGCYQYDPVEYRITCTCKITAETIETIMSKIYPDLNITEIKKRLK